MTTASDITLHLGDCLEVMAGLPDGSVDAIVTDPPYAEVSRPYGRLTEADWHKLMNAVVVQCRRILKPTGSALFVIQPNSEKVGRVRPWVWEFMAKWTREWNMVQDAWWWNYAMAPTVHCQRKYGLMRPSVKPCVWLGEPACFRDQVAVLWEESDSNKAARLSDRCSNDIDRFPSGQTMRRARCSGLAFERGGTTPFNLLPITNANSTDSAGSHGHGARTPYPLAEWWVRYISPPGGVVLDPFMGSGTIPLAALARGRNVIGIEKDSDYFAVAEQRIATARFRPERSHASPARPKKPRASTPACTLSLFGAFEAEAS